MTSENQQDDHQSPGAEPRDGSRILSGEPPHPLQHLTEGREGSQAQQSAAALGLPPSALSEPSAERFYIDHGMIHDRVTGQHVTTDGQPPFENGIDHCVGLLNDLSRLAEPLQQFVNGVETFMLDSPADEILATVTARAKAALRKATAGDSTGAAGGRQPSVPDASPVPTPVGDQEGGVQRAVEAWTRVAYMDTESHGSPDPEKRACQLRVSWCGPNASVDAYAVQDFLLAALQHAPRMDGKGSLAAKDVAAATPLRPVEPNSDRPETDGAK